MERKIVFIGSGDLCFRCAKELKDKRKDIVIYEYMSYSQSKLKELCLRENISYFKIDDKKQMYNILLNMGDVFLISANSTYVIPKQIVEKPDFSGINFHPGLLPKHKGRNAEAWSIYDGDEYSGITWHYIDEKVDHGQIIIQKRIKLDTKVTSLRLMREQFRLGIESFIEIIDDVLAHSKDYELTKGAMGFPSKGDKEEKVHYSWDKPNDGCLNLEWGAEKMSSFLRSMDYGSLEVLGKPYCNYRGERYVWNRYRINECNSEETENISEGIIIRDNIMINLVGFRRDERNNI